MNANPIKIIEVKNKWEKNGLKNELKTHWTRLENTPGVFRYKLNVQKKKVLPGGCKFVAQVLQPSRGNERFNSMSNIHFIQLCS